MAGRANIFYLYSLESGEKTCSHPVLLRVALGEYAGWSQTEEDAAWSECLSRRDRLLKHYERGILTFSCAANHNSHFLGEFHYHPEGDELYGPQGRNQLDLWVSDTTHGHPYIAMGMAATEEEFWQICKRDGPEDGFEAIPPARNIRVFFLTQSDLPRTQSDSP